MNELLLQPFILRALYGGLLVAATCSIMGVFVTLRKQTFLSDGIAHAALTGIAIGLLLSWQPVITAMIFAVIMAVIITYINRHVSISQDSAIGIVYSVLFAVGVVLVSMSDTFKPDLLSYLFGSILAITWLDVGLAAVAFLLLIVVLFKFYNRIVYMVFDPEAAFIRGVKVELWEYILNIFTSIIIIISVKIVGVILVTALLVIPASIAKILSRRFADMIPISLTSSIIITCLGMWLSILLDIPSGATIIILGGVLFILLIVLRKFLRWPK